VVLLDPQDGNVLQAFDLSTHAIVPSSFPYTVIASKDGRRAWCSLWNRSRVAELDLDKGTVTRWISLLEPKDPIAPGSHPTAMALSKDEKQLYVALSNADRLAVVSTETGGVQSLMDTTAPGQKYPGSCPSAIALSPDGQTVFVADASLNAVAVFNRTSTLENAAGTQLQSATGFIPTDWYPSALAVVGNDLVITTAKGIGTGPNNGPGGTGWERRHHEHPYIPTLLYGSLARLDYSQAEKNLAELTRKVEDSNLLRSEPGKIRFHTGNNPIKHVIYVLKENRTYDQVFGDLKVGNGDSSLTMYGADITPNEHKLALQFGVLDNFYDSGEVSGDGHEWSSAAITSDYDEKTWQIGYRSKERTYDFQGTVADEFPLENGEPDVDAPATGYIWDNLAAHGLSYRIYGEFVLAVWCKPPADAAAPPSDQPAAECAHSHIRKGDPLPSNVGDPHGSASPYPWSIPVLRRMRPTKANLREHYDPLYPDFNTDYPDQLRADEFLNEFARFVKARQEGKGSGLPQFVLLYLPDDHTGGTRVGKPTPSASVADNDLAVGRVVDAVSHSPYWDDTAIFVIEDDAQDGADHVDAHRSTALVISKYSPGGPQHPFVASRFYTTVNMMHTMETLLGLPPMNQNDAYAPVMAPLFSGEGTQPAYSVDVSNRENGLIYKTNPPRTQGARESEKMDFSRPDAVNTRVLNTILWKDRKGDAPVPPPQHSVVPARAGDGD
ncbi:MAG TPA: beta-propeller fold lactonase family protein, partial [Terriglobales bacterium]|nr:beta-propeller fold lactonase family protein [Terriglobales bacterium]